MPGKGTVTRACEVCGAAFEVIAAVVRKGYGRFCSKACFGASCQSRVSVACQGCGAEFLALPSKVRAGAGKFCSTACRYPTRVVRPCENCGTEVSKAPCFILDHVFCSLACHVQWKTLTPADHIRRKVDASAGPDACWPWTGSRDRAGYGKVSMVGKDIRAHRAAWEVANDQTVPDGLVIRHLCPGGGNPWCCNPAHLAPGTHKENAEDKVKAGRHRNGATAARERLSGVDRG